MKNDKNVDKKEVNKLNAKGEKILEQVNSDIKKMGNTDQGKRK